MVKISKREWINRLYSAGDATESEDLAYDEAYAGLRYDYGSYTILDIPELSALEKMEFKDFMENSNG